MNYQRMGMAALIPGMQFMIDRMQKELDDLRQVLTGLQQEKETDDDEPVGDLEKWLYKRKSKSSKSYWAGMTPKERSAEMKRRAKVAFDKKQAATAPGEEVDIDSLHPRDSRSPRHKAYVAKVKRGQKRYWDNLSPEARETRISNMINARGDIRHEHINGRAN